MFLITGILFSYLSTHVCLASSDPAATLLYNRGHYLAAFRLHVATLIQNVGLRIIEIFVHLYECNPSAAIRTFLVPRREIRSLGQPTANARVNRIGLAPLVQVNWIPRVTHQPRQPLLPV